MKTSLLLKAAVVGALAFVLMIPVAMIRDLVAERQARRNEALAGIAEGWGKRQTIAGPYIAVPYERAWTEVKHEAVEGKLRESRIERSESRVLRVPATGVEWGAVADITEKARGIYKARLYGAFLEAQGRIELPSRASLEDGRSRYRWGTPRLVLGVSDPLGIRVATGPSVDGATYAFAPGSGDHAIGGGLHALLDHLKLDKARTVSFTLALELGGSEAFALAPLGADTALAMRADWPHPSFQGRFLPARHDITESGFTANWRISRLAAHSGAKDGNCAWPCAQMAEQIHVSFIEPAGLYQQLERASKYGFLFVGLTAAAFMLFELLRRLAIHPVQYALVGLALAMFFLLLTALSEHIDFGYAYAIATFACAGLISSYVIVVLKSKPLGLAFGGALAALYAMLYALLKVEDYALLGGALLLFALLAAVMLATRRVDWYGLAPTPGPAAPGWSPAPAPQARG